MMAKKNRKTQQLIEKLTEECTAHEQFIATLEEKISSFDYTQDLIDQLEEVSANTESVVRTSIPPPHRLPSEPAAIRSAKRTNFYDEPLHNEKKPWRPANRT